MQGSWRNLDLILDLWTSKFKTLLGPAILSSQFGWKNWLADITIPPHMNRSSSQGDIPHDQAQDSILIFVSGKIVLIGAKVREEIYMAFEIIYPVLNDFRKVPSDLRVVGHSIHPQILRPPISSYHSRPYCTLRNYNNLLQ